MHQLHVKGISNIHTESYNMETFKLSLEQKQFFIYMYPLPHVDCLDDNMGNRIHLFLHLMWCFFIDYWDFSSSHNNIFTLPKLIRSRKMWIILWFSRKNSRVIFVCLQRFGVDPWRVAHICVWTKFSKLLQGLSNHWHTVCMFCTQTWVCRLEAW